MKIFSTILIFCASIFVYAQIPLDKPVFTINGEAILATTYYRRLEVMQGVYQKIGQREVAVPPGFMMLEKMVNETLTIQLAKKKGVMPTAAEIDAELKIRKTDSPDSVEGYKRAVELGLTDEDFKHDIAVDLAQFNLITAGVVVTDQQVNEHYATNKFMYSTTATVKMRVIVVKNATDREKVDTLLKAGDFAAIARQYSIDLTKFDGGNIPESPIGNLPQNIRNEVSLTAAGKDTNWIESGGSFLKYRIETKKEPQQLPLDDKLKRRIKRRLMLDIGSNKNNVKAQMDDLRKTLKVVATNPGFQKIWDAYLADYLKQIGGKT